MRPQSTHDYKRNGTTTRSAASNVKTGEGPWRMFVLGDRAKEFIRLPEEDRPDRKEPSTSTSISSSTTTRRTRQGSSGVAGAESTFQIALHSDFVVLAEPRSALLRRDQEASASGAASSRASPSWRPPSMTLVQKQCLAKTLRLDKDRQHHSQETSPCDKLSLGAVINGGA